MGDVRTRRAPRRASARLRKKMREAYAAGASIRALQDQTRLSYGAVRQVLIGEGVMLRPRGDSTRRADIPPHITAIIAALPVARKVAGQGSAVIPPAKPHRIPADELDAIMKDYAAGVPIRRLKCLYKYSCPTISRALRLAGVTIRRGRSARQMNAQDSEAQVTTPREDSQ